jgi:hypothetical protein
VSREFPESEAEYEKERQRRLTRHTYPFLILFAVTLFTFPWWPEYWQRVLNLIGGFILALKAEIVSWKRFSHWETEHGERLIAEGKIIPAKDDEV